MASPRLAAGGASRGAGGEAAHGAQAGGDSGRTGPRRIAARGHGGGPRRDDALHGCVQLVKAGENLAPSQRIAETGLDPGALLQSAVLVCGCGAQGLEDGGYGHRRTLAGAGRLSTGKAGIDPDL